MKLIGLFNTVDSGNIGLENLMGQKYSFEPVILVVKQSRSTAVAEMSSNYPGHQASVMVARDYKANSIVGGVQALIGLTPAVVHGHHAQAALVGAVVRCIRKVRLVTTAHNKFSTYKRRHKLAFAVAFLISDRVICNSEGTMASLPWFIRKRKVSVIYNGVDFRRLDQVLQTSAHRKSDGYITVGTVCRMVPQKDLPTLLHGFRMALRHSEVPLRLRLVGDGEQRAEVERLIRTLDIGDAVDLTGSVPREEVYRNLVDMDIFVVSSRWEGFCNAMVEAAAAGKAIIASDIEPLPEVMGRENAVFFEVGNSEALCKEILGLCRDAGRRTKLGEQGREFARGRYSLDVSAERYGSVYEKLAEEIRES